jgi:hypothetical protein
MGGPRRLYRANRLLDPATNVRTGDAGAL